MEAPQTVINPAEPTQTPDSPAPDSQPPIGDTPPMPPIETPPDQAKVSGSKKRFSKKILLIIFVLVLLGAGATYAYLSMSKEKPATSTAPKTTTTETAVKKAVPESVLYYSQAKTGEPYIIYSRPAAGGERKAVLTLSKKVGDNYYSVGANDVRGQNVVFATDDGVYVSQDGGTTFKNVYPVDAAHTNNDKVVTSVHFSTDNKKVVFASIVGSSGTSKNIVRAMDLDGKNIADLHTFDAAGAFIYSFNSTKQELVYATGCYFCDGGPKPPRLMNTKSGADKELVTVDGNTEILNNVSSNSDGSKLVYYLGAYNKAAEAEVAGVGWQGAPPYKIMELDVATAKSTQAGTVGAANEKSSDGMFKMYQIRTGFTEETQQVFYTADAKLYVVSSAKPSLLFEATKNIWSVPYVSADDVFSSVDSSTNSNGDYTFYRYVTSSKKSTSIYEGTSDTQVMGVTTK